jgi:hypothetical protein
LNFWAQIATATRHRITKAFLKFMLILPDGR